jgi:hypothetical protein
MQAMWIMDDRERYLPHLPTRGNKPCLDMITAAIHAPLYTKPPTTQSLLDVAVGEL